MTDDQLVALDLYLSDKDMRLLSEPRADGVGVRYERRSGNLFWVALERPWPPCSWCKLTAFDCTHNCVDWFPRAEHPLGGYWKRSTD